MAGQALSTDQDLNVAWREVIARIDKETGLFKTGIKTLDEISPDDVVSKITPPEKSQQAQKAKAVFNDVLLVIQQFGNVISDAAGAAFEPSKQCINGINILIVAVQKTQKLFDDVVVLLERVGVFLHSLKFWFDKQDPLDIRLRRPVYHVLEHFIEIVALTHKLATHQKSEWLKALLKGVFLGGDQRVMNAIAMLETRVSDVTRIQVAVICKDLQGAARDVREMRGDMELMLRNEAHHTVVLESVNFKVDHLVDSEDLRYVRHKVGEYADGVRWSKEQASLHYTRPGTGQWLFERQDFIDWQSNGTVFMIKAGRGRGRSSLAHAIIKHIQPQAYHYLRQAGPGRSQGHEAAKSIIWQLASRDREFCRFVRQTDVDWDDKLDLWQKLLMPRSATIVIDNVQDIDPQWTFGKVLTADTKLKLCLLGQLEGFERYNTVPCVSLDGASLDCGPDFPNARDVALCIDHRLSSLQDMLPHRERIRSALLEHIQNDFVTLYAVLDDIGHCKNVRQLNVVLTATASKAIDRIESMIEALNRKLSQDEILQLNTILCWLSVASHCSQDLPMLRQYLVACGMQLNLGRYSYMLKVEEDVIDWRDYQIKTYLRQRSEFERLTQRQHRQVLDPEEAALVNTLIRTHLSNVLGTEGNAIYDRFGFEQFFREKMGLTTARIRLDEGAGHVALLDACLSVLTIDLHREDVRNFRVYAAQHFHGHLSKADISSASSQLCQAIAIKLVRFLSNKESMIAFWTLRTPEASEYEDPLILGDYEKDYLRWLEWIDEIPAMHEAKTWLRSLATKDIFYEITCAGVQCWYEKADCAWHMLRHDPYTNQIKEHIQRQAAQAQIPARQWIEDQASRFGPEVILLYAVENFKNAPGQYFISLRDCFGQIPRKGGSNLFAAAALWEHWKCCFDSEAEFRQLWLGPPLRFIALDGERLIESLRTSPSLRTNSTLHAANIAHADLAHATSAFLHCCEKLVPTSRADDNAGHMELMKTLSSCLYGTRLIVKVNGDRLKKLRGWIEPAYNKIARDIFHCFKVVGIIRPEYRDDEERVAHMEGLELFEFVITAIGDPLRLTKGELHP